jgi:aldose 1-epimerase
LETPLFEISTPQGLSVKISAIGATVCSIKLDGQELTLGYDSEAAYAQDPFYLGATVGPYANRIRSAKFCLQQQQFQLTANDGEHCLHGGDVGLNRLRWQLETQAPDQLTLCCSVADGDGGFPGNRVIRCHFKVQQTELQLQFDATTDAPTVLSLTNHCYFNLDAQAANIDDHLLQSPLSQVLDKDQGGMPTGRLLNCAEQYPNLRAGQRLSQMFSQSGALDHCFVVGHGSQELQPLATLTSPDQRLSLTVLSDLPGLQIYSGDGLSAPFRARQGLCLEAQYWPDAPNQPEFPSPVLLAGDVYQHQIIYRFAQQNTIDLND